MKKKSPNKLGFPLWWIPLLLLGLYLSPHWLRDIPMQVWILIIPVIPVAIAKLISQKKGDEGKMSRAYKNAYRENKRMYYIFCGSVVIFPVIIVTLENIPYDAKLLSANAEKIVGILWLALAGICGIGWVLTEVVRRKDFPWGIFRLIERLFYLAVMVAAAFVGSDFAAAVIKRYPGFFQGMILLIIPVAYFLAVFFFFGTIRELVLIAMYPDPVKRAAFRASEDERMRRKSKEEEEELKRRWDKASPTDIYGRNFYRCNIPLKFFEVRHEGCGLYIDKQGRIYFEDDVYVK